MICIFIILSFFLNLNAQTKDKYELDAVVVTASRIPSVFFSTPRTLSIIDKEEIKTLPVTSVQELLEYTIGVDLRQAPLLTARVTARGS